MEKRERKKLKKTTRNKKWDAFRFFSSLGDSQRTRTLPFFLSTLAGRERERRERGSRGVSANERERKTNEKEPETATTFFFPFDARRSAEKPKKRRKTLHHGLLPPAPPQGHPRPRQGRICGRDHLPARAPRLDALLGARRARKRCV